ncbi:hypothetical protein A3D11_00715, partial [Candidatus Peribacteria bacterium RIFCSPHIGHO2_02_FULL_49_16]
MKMRISRVVVSTIATVAILTQNVLSLHAAASSYTDVPRGTWYEKSVQVFVDAGYLDLDQTNFRAADNANRAEFIKLIVELSGGILSTPPAVASFNDVPLSAWYYGYMEDAAKEGWVRGDGDCYGTTPCYARPGASINRAEAAALIVRAFGLEWKGDAPQFVDNPAGLWYTDGVQTAADYCILQGDDRSGRVRPTAFMNRAEMIVMLDRADQDLQHGRDCGEENEADIPGITSVVPVTASEVVIAFTHPISNVQAENIALYAMNDMEVIEATLLDDTTIKLLLEKAMMSGEEYTLTITNLELADGGYLSATTLFPGFSPVIQGDGVLELSIAAGSPAGDTIPKGTQGVSMLSVDFVASCDDDVVLENLTVVHQGFGAVSDITGIYATMDGERVTRKRTIDSEDQTADLHFAQRLTIPACGTKTIDLVGDFLSTATTSGEHNLAIELPSDVKSNAKEVSGN